ncbi:hypothetical protein [Paenibacillus sp. RC67]|uniref:hypothetical protein n=1 Tax=Paenibacillus sp. RC67 TaxID=3039392 RepID=UPI0024AD9791|nr:hypothetical protein [Paenibacillus sp. RC67]
MMRKALVIVIFLVVTLGVGGYIASNYAVNYVLRSIATSPSAVEKDASSDPLPEPQETKSKVGTSSASSKTTGAEGPSKDEKTENSNKDAGPNKQEQTIRASAKPDAEEMDPGQKLKYSAEVSPEKAKNVEQSVTTKEKTQVMTVLISKLSASELQLFIKMATNGLSVEEKKEAKKIILKKLTEEEYDQLISIAAKYGLSQGKSYKDSLEE